MPAITRTFKSIAIFLIAVCSTSISHAENTAPVAIGGYSPVSYFTEGRAELGSSEFASEHDGQIFYFTDAQQLALFEADPQAYAPLFPNHCPYSLTLGRTVEIDPTNFKIVGDALLLFHRSDEMDGLEKWDMHGDDEELLESARNQWTLLRF